MNNGGRGRRWLIKYEKDAEQLNSIHYTVKKKLYYVFDIGSFYIPLDVGKNDCGLEGVVSRIAAVSFSVCDEWLHWINRVSFTPRIY